jgi:aspartate/methionine/tyrosine aminotransferase
MLRRPAYLAWAMRHYGRVGFDLASSGIPSLPQSELGALASLDDPGGWDRLCRAIAGHHRLPLGEVVPALGASHGLWLAYSALLEPGEEVLVEAPTYEPLIVAAEAAGAVVRRFDRSASSGYAVDPERVFAALTPKTRVVAITNLHNPSGVRASDEALRAIAERLARSGGHLFVDEVYAPFDHLVGPDGVFFGTARRLGANVVTTSSLTKAYGLGPQRVGWVLGPDRVIERANDALIASLGALPLAWMHRGVLALEHVGVLAERTRTLLGDKRARVAAWMAARPQLAWSRPEAGLFGFAMVEGAGDLRPAIERGIESHDVIVAPGSFFGVQNGFRLGWSLPEAKLDEALSRLDAVLGGVERAR